MSGSTDRTPPGQPDRPAADEGALTVVAAVAILAVMAFTALGVHLGAAVLARHRAEAAADLGALAGAARLSEGTDSACGAARAIVTRNRAALTECIADGLDLLITTSVRVSVGPIGGSAHARARAGP